MKLFLFKPQLFFWALLVFCLVGIASCGTHDNMVTINIVAPLSNAIFNTGEVVHFEIDCSATDDLHEVKVKIKNEITGEEETLYEGHDHDAEYTFSYDWTAPSVSDTTVFKLQGEVEDHDGTVISSERDFVVNP